MTASLRNVWTGAAGTTGAVSATIGTHSIGNLLIGAAEGDNTDFGSDPSGWTVLCSITGNVNKLKVWYRVATSTTENVDHPFTITPTSGNHTYVNGVTIQDQHAIHAFHQVIQAFHGGVGTVSGSAGLDTQIDDVYFLQILGYGADHNGSSLVSGEANSGVTGLAVQLSEGTISGNGGGLIILDGTVPSPTTVPATSWTAGTSTHWCQVTLAIAPAAAFTIADTVTINGSPAPDGESVRALDLTQPAASYLCSVGTTSGGTGAFSISAPYDDHDYQAVYEDGASYGASAVDQAV